MAHLHYTVSLNSATSHTEQAAGYTCQQWEPRRLHSSCMSSTCMPPLGAVATCYTCVLRHTRYIRALASRLRVSSSSSYTLNDFPRLRGGGRRGPFPHFLQRNLTGLLQHLLSNGRPCRVEERGGRVSALLACHLATDGRGGGRGLIATRGAATACHTC